MVVDVRLCDTVVNVMLNRSQVGLELTVIPVLHFILVYVPVNVLSIFIPTPSKAWTIVSRDRGNLSNRKILKTQVWPKWPEVLTMKIMMKH